MGLDWKVWAMCIVAACWILAFGSLTGAEVFNYEVMRASLPIAWIVVAITAIAGVAAVGIAYMRR